ncbi:MAG: creatininase family protein, partial [Candidatus Heimdallarchaeota archaeon]|nr:creatininase family protein [Candidatus Heimdallarchaeota archaeon]
MAQKRFLQEMTWPEFRDAIQDAIVIVPIGATEQHGPHLPLGTDSLASYEILKRALQQISEDIKVIVTPQLNIGLSIEHLDFPGTLSFKNAGDLISTVKGVCKNLVDYGAKKIVLWNGHGGNIPSLKAATREVRREMGAFVVMTTYW